MTTNTMAWRDRAACTRSNPGLFSPGPGASADTAKAICRRCPVLIDCLFWALRHSECGVWGGTTTTERAALRAWDRQVRAPRTRRKPKPAAVSTTVHKPAKASAQRRQRRQSRLETYAELRREGHTIAQATERMRVSHRTAQRYEASLQHRDRTPPHARGAA